MLAMEDLKEKTEAEIILHIRNKFCQGWDSMLPEADFKGVKLLVAYESVGDYGCDSVSWVLFEKDGQLYENHASHCSCYGFEDQWKPEKTTEQYLLSDKFYFSCGGYCNGKDCAQTVKDYLEEYFA